MLAGAALAVAPFTGLAAGPAKPPAIYIVAIADMKFAAPPAAIHVGDTIEWVNNDIFLHSATAKDGGFDVDLPPKAHRWTTFHTAGTFAFACRYHPGMTGALVVTGQAR